MGLNEISAFEVINTLSEIDLKSIIKILGDEKDAFRRKKYSQYRKERKITSTADLVKIIEKVKREIF